MGRRKGISMERVQVPLGNPYSSPKRTAAPLEHRQHGRHGYSRPHGPSGSLRALENLPGRTATLKDLFSSRCYRWVWQRARRRWNAGLGIGCPLDRAWCGVDGHCFCGDLTRFCLVLRGFATGDGSTWRHLFFSTTATAGLDCSGCV